jgi:hypothetical protein
VHPSAHEPGARFHYQVANNPRLVIEEEIGNVSNLAVSGANGVILEFLHAA